MLKMPEHGDEAYVVYTKIAHSRMQADNAYKNCYATLLS
jgi:hypothetical protein